MRCESERASGEPASCEPEAACAIETLISQGYEQLAEGRFEEAAETFSAALLVDSRQAQALRGRGLARLQLKQWAVAAADFSAAMRMDPNTQENWVALGLCQAAEGEFYPALNTFEALLTRWPGYVRGHIELGLLHFRLGAIPKGRQCLQQALTCRPSLAERRSIESMLREQDRQDTKRYYRPDFEALHRQQRSTSPLKMFSEWVRRRTNKTRHDG